MYKSISMHDKLSLKARESKTILGGGRPKTWIQRSLLTNTACMQTRCYLNKSDPEVLMESIINKEYEVLTWCIPVAAGASIYSGLVWILNNVSHAYSHVCRITSSGLSGIKISLRKAATCFIKASVVNADLFFNRSPYLRLKNLPIKLAGLS